MLFSELLTNLGTLVGLSDLVPDENQSCRLSIDNNIVDMKVVGDEEHLLFFAEIAPLPQEKREELVTQILGGNYLFSATAGATLGLNTTNNTLYLQQQEALAALDAMSFEKLLETFVNTVETWKRLLTDLQEGESGNASDIKSDLEEPNSFNLLDSTIRI